MCVCMPVSKMLRGVGTHTRRGSRLQAFPRAHVVCSHECGCCSSACASLSPAHHARRPRGELYYFQPSAAAPAARLPTDEVKDSELKGDGEGSGV